jgi:ABC-type dipeptide/oligopeptide/nickel transport system permease subunit
MGTDLLGRDILSRVIYGSRLSLLIGLASVAIGVLAGVVVGLVSGYYGGGIDRFLMRLVDAMLAFPGILLALTVVSTLGPGIRNVMLAVGIASIPSYARLTRGTVLSAKQNVYVEAAEVVGCSAPRTMFYHILPNVIAPILVVSTLQFGVAVISASGLSFLGLGAQPPTPEWGLMVSLGRNYLGKAWWLSTFPGLAITVTVIAINLIGDGLRESLDPRLRSQ